ncbi:MAG: nicotinamide riboside transporter PnuC [Chitinophagales bacterium]
MLNSWLNNLSLAFTLTEYLAVFYGVLYVLLAAKSDLHCWPAGVISSALYIYINIYAHLYMDAILQTYYVLAGIYGWWLWSRNSSTNHKLQIQFYTLGQNIPLILLGCVLTPILGYLFSKIGNSYSYFDAGITIFSFIATWMTAKKILQNWLYWIVIDFVAAALYFAKDLRATSALYVLFALVAIYGYKQWQQNLKSENH